MNNSLESHFFRVTCLLLITLTLSQEIIASEIEEVIVTAEFRDTRLMDSAKSIDVINEEGIDVRGARHIEEVINLVPNVNFASGTSRARFFQIRGIGERSQFVEPVNPSVGILVDDVDFTGAGTVAGLFDVQQIEVLKGPQGTRYGANALAGLINIKTNDPAEEFESSLHLGAGSYQKESLGIIVSGPLNSELGFRVAGQKHSSNGFINNAYLGRNDTNNLDEQTIRTKLYWSPGDIYSLKVNLFTIDFDNGYDAFALDNTRVTLSDEPGHDRQDSLGLSLSNSWKLPLYDLKLIVSTSDSEMAYGYDEDWTYIGIHPWEYSSADNYIRDRKTAGYEWRLVSNDDSRIFNNTTEWVLGFYGLESREDLLRQYTYLPSDYTSGYDYLATAVYAQMNSVLSGSWELGTGIRIESRQADYDTSDGLSLRHDDTHTTGRVTLKKTDRERMFYFSLARGVKAGGFNTDGTLDASLRSFGAEKLTEMEIGLKQYFLAGNLATRMALFYDDRSNQQVKSSLVLSRPDGSTEFVDFIDNAADGTNKGFEGELDWYVTDNLALTASLGILQAEFDNYVNEFGENLSGRDQAHAPSYMYSLSMNYRMERLSFWISVEGKDEFYLSDRHDVMTSTYNLVNASLTYELSALTIRLWGRNLADKDYYTRGFGSFGNDPRKFYAVEPYFQFGEPRVAGIDLVWTIK